MVVTTRQRLSGSSSCINMANCGSQCILSCLKTVALEPMVFLFFVSITMGQVVMQVGTYRVICQQVFVHSHPEIDCDHLSNFTLDGEPAEDTVQRYSTLWGMAFSVASLVPSIFMDILLSAHGDRYGRKVNMMLGMIALIISHYSYIVLYTYPLQIPLYFIVICSLLTGFTGSGMITVISSNAYLVDTVSDKRQLAVRLMLLMLAIAVGSVAGSSIAGKIVQILSRPQILIMAQGLAALAFFYCMVFIRQVPPSEIRKLKSDRPAEENGGKYNWIEVRPKEGEDEGNKKTRNKSIFGIIPELFKESMATFTKKREGNGRAYLLCICFVSLVNVISEQGSKSAIFGTYVQKAPLSWDDGAMGTFRGAQAAIGMLGGSISVIVLQRCMQLNITFLLLICTVLDVLEMVILAFSTKTWLVYMSAVVDSVTGVSAPCLQTILAKLVELDEVGKVYALFGITTSVGNLISSLINSPIYYATLSFFPGFVFLFSAGLLSLRFMVMLWMHVDMNFRNDDTKEGCWKKSIASIFSKEETGKTEISPVVERM